MNRILLSLAATVLAHATALATEMLPATIGAEQLRSLAEARTLAELQASPLARGAARVEVEAGALDSRLRLAACASPLQVEVDLSRATGRTNAKLSCIGAEPWSVYVPVQLRAYRLVVVATRSLERGDTIQGQDVALEERDVLAGGGRLLESLDEAVGTTPRRAIAVHQALNSNAIELPVLVRRGERISLGARAGGIAVTASAEALANGREGERIRVRNTQSQRVVDAVVTGPGQAEVI